MMNDALRQWADDAGEVAGYLWQKGWAERNAGNISVDITALLPAAEESADRAEARALAQLKNEYDDQINVIALDVDASSTAESLEQFKQAADNGAYTWAFDSDFKVASSYQVNALDTTLILDAKGIIVYRDQVPTTHAALKGELEKLLP